MLPTCKYVKSLVLLLRSYTRAEVELETYNLAVVFIFLWLLLFRYISLQLVSNRNTLLHLLGLTPFFELLAAEFLALLLLRKKAFLIDHQ